VEGEAVVIHQAVHLRLLGVVLAEGAGLLTQRSRDSMPALSVRLLTANINRARVPSAITGGSVFGTVRLALAEGAAEWLAVVIRAVVETLSVLAH
jgi:hypothetical protein